MDRPNPSEVVARIKANNPVCYTCKHLTAINIDGTVSCDVYSNTSPKAWCVHYLPVEVK